MADITIYHNGQCSKCKGALEILIEQKVPHNVRWYLSDPLSREELQALLKKLGIKPSELVRKSEELYQHYEGKTLSEEEWLNILVGNPILIQRPIIEKGAKAIIARPPEKVFEMIGPANMNQGK